MENPAGRIPPIKEHTKLNTMAEWEAFLKGNVNAYLVEHSCVKCSHVHRHEIAPGVTKISQLWDSSPSIGKEGKKSGGCGNRCFVKERLASPRTA